MSESRKKMSPNLILLGVAVLAHVPILIEYSIRMWRSGHYQFFPLVVAVVGYLMWQNSDRVFSRNRSPANPAVVSGLLFLDFGLVAVATLLNSSFLGAISFLLLIGSAIYWFSGRKGFVASLPYLFVMLFIVPLPINLDRALIFKMQFLASSLASLILDAVGQIHFRQGVVLFTEQGSYLTEEACSGVKSLFSALTTIAIYGAINDYPWWRQALNLLQTIFWVVIGNAIRIVIVVVVTDHWTPLIASGLGHELLGLAIYSFIVLMAVSFDRIPNLWKQKSRTGTSKAQAIHATIPDIAKNAARPYGNWILVAIFLVLAVLGTRIAWVRYVGQDRIRITYERLPFSQQSDLPTLMGGWTQTDFQHENRGKHQLEAEDSFIWTLSNGELEVQISIDCPWDDWHDLSNCYHGLGWRGKPEHVFENDRDVTGFSELKMNRPTGEEGIVFFSSVDRYGDPVVPKIASGYFSVTSIGRQIASNFLSSMGYSPDESRGLKGIALPASTIQAVCMPNKRLSDAEIAEIGKLFDEARSRLVNSNRFRGAKN